MKADFGIIYVATGSTYICEAVRSARDMMPEVPLAIWVDDEGDLPRGLFDQTSIIAETTFSYIDKIGPLVETPFKKTLFLDTDILTPTQK